MLPFQDETTLLDALSRGGISLTIVEAGGESHALAVRTLRRVSEAFPLHPLVAWCDFRRLQSAELLDVARAGVQDIVRHDLDELRFTFARILASATQRAAGTRIHRALEDVVSPRLRPVFEYALEHADVRLERHEIAAVFGISRRTLHDRLIDGGLPPTRTFLIWCRLLVAGALLDQPGHTLDSVAGQLGFTDGHNLGNTLRRYTGAGINRLRDGSVLDATIAAFRAAVSASANSGDAT